MHQLPYYRYNDSISSLSCGLVQQLLMYFTYAMTLGVYRWIQQHHGLLHFSSLSSIQTLVAGSTLFLGVDFCYYWFHRMAHHVNIGWASHVTHHSSEEYNLTTALRQGAFQHFFSFSFYLPLAWIGYPPSWFISMVALNAVSQFWVHTRTIDKFPSWFEFIFNTPSHHRVHHGKNSIYIDKNHAGVLIIWDRLFGTFTPETVPVEYGITTPLRSWNPIWSQLHQIVFLWNQMRQTSRFFDKIRVWYKNPGWVPSGAPTLPTISIEKFDPPTPACDVRRACIWFGVAMILYLPFPHLPTFLQGIVALLVMGMLLQCGRLFTLPEKSKLPSVDD